MKLSVIIVSYNAVDYLRNCLKSVLEHLPESAEVIVFDNNSPDQSVREIPKEFPAIKYIQSSENLGFSKGNNLAAKSAKSEYLLILNPDTVVYADFFPTILKFAQNHSNMGALGVRMMNGDGEFLPESKRNIPTPLGAFSKLFLSKKESKTGYYQNILREDEDGEVEILTGANMLIKKVVYDEVGGFDERYFMYGEDIDLSYTLLQKGYKNYYLGTIFITHFKSVSVVKNQVYLDRFYGAMELFVEKYYRKQQPLLYPFLIFGLKIRKSLAQFKLK